MKRFKLVFCLLISSQQSPATVHELIFWNVGQGQWSTVVTDSECFHFDMGGERAPIKKIKKICYQKNQILYLSHYDWDHRSFIYPFAKDQKICLGNKPLQIKKKKISMPLSPCGESGPHSVDLIFEGETRTSNGSSQVFFERLTLALFPGDSTASQEKKWSRHHFKNVQVLALGHHGSQTSSSNYLLHQLKNLKLAVASSRFEKYGHPHKEVIARLKRNRIPLLSTEDWGNIRYKRKSQ